MKKQDSVIQIRVNRPLKMAFRDVTKSSGKKYSAVMRELMRDYLQNEKIKPVTKIPTN